ncbi:MAG: Histidine-tRNA ligase [candidate division WWE3 bacterium GW2011_GWB1_42_6]|uniref:Histidine--tRNA ligase n=1 Tax=candidate division WWE3 bacterium GW2011_GWB1_42_6 TaxID=1619115 RepID=A0A0G1D6H9_UNCKA|nr:MAG: Histidine-tRNA ligase [candidate division WWE3 bacterium GW2011_GWB1_42_6]
MAKVTPRIQAGFMELLPAEQILFNKMMKTISETFEEFGYAPLDTPLVENAEVLFAQIGEDTKKEVYRFSKGDDDLGLRFDLTVPLARYVAMYSNSLTFPFRRYQIGKAYRGERPQKGRFREFYQADIDIVGSGSLSLVNDAEVPAVINRVFEKLQLGDFVIKISNRKILSGLMEEYGVGEKKDEVLRVVDKLEKVGEETAKQMLIDLEIKVGEAEKILEFVKISGSNAKILETLNKMEIESELFKIGVSELTEVVEKAIKFGVSEKNLEIDLAIARGLSYYTGTVYETKLLDERVKGSVCGGGRYDNLAESFSNQSFPGVGVSIGLTRLFSQLLDAGVIKATRATTAKVLVVPMEADMPFALEVAGELRELGVPTELYTEDDKFKKKLVYANKIGVPYVAIIGEDEVAEKKVSLKNMTTGKQELLEIKAVAEKI